MVPPRHETVKRRGWLWVLGIAAALCVAAGAYYYKAQNDAKIASQAALVSVPTMVGEPVPHEVRAGAVVCAVAMWTGTPEALPIC